MNMELDEFITKTINSVIKGVSDSQTFAKENGAIVNPLGHNDFDGTTRSKTTINFDIAVTTSLEKETGVNGGITVFSISAGGKAIDKDSSNSVSKVAFDLMVCLPFSRA